MPTNPCPGCEALIPHHGASVSITMRSFGSRFATASDSSVRKLHPFSPMYTSSRILRSASASSHVPVNECTHPPLNPSRLRRTIAVKSSAAARMCRNMGRPVARVISNCASNHLRCESASQNCSLS